MEWISCIIGAVFLIWIVISDIRDKIEQLNISGRLNGTFYSNQKAWLNDLKSNRRWIDRNPQTLYSEYS